MKKIPKFKLLVLVIILPVSLTACMGITGRLFTVREQLCGTDDYLSVQLDQEVKITLREPVLLERDVYLLMDALPTTRIEDSRTMVASYVFEQQAYSDGVDHMAPTGQEIEIGFLFVPSDKGFLLSGISSDGIPPELLNSVLPLLANSDEMLRRACDTSINLLSRSVLVDIDPDVLEILPPRQSLIAWLGEPLDAPDHGDDLVYKFRLKGHTSDRLLARIDVDYDPAGDRPVAVGASFARYQANIDVPAGTMQVKLYR